MTLPRSRRAAVAVMASRAVIGAGVAVLITFTRNLNPAFNQDHDARFGLAVLGGFALLQAVPVAVAALAVAPTREGRFWLWSRVVLSLVIGTLALALLPRDDVVLLVGLQAVLFLGCGACEIAGGVRRVDGTPQGDAIVVGGLQVLVGAMLVILDRDAVFTAGVLGAWGAIVAVYLGIAAVSAAREDAR